MLAVVAVFSMRPRTRSATLLKRHCRDGMLTFDTMAGGGSDEFFAHEFPSIVTTKSFQLFAITKIGQKILEVLWHFRFVLQEVNPGEKGRVDADDQNIRDASDTHSGLLPVEVEESPLRLPGDT